VTRKYNISGYEWDLLETEGCLSGLAQAEWYETFIANRDWDNLNRLLVFYVPPKDSYKVVLEDNSAHTGKPLPKDKKSLKEVLQNPHYQKNLHWRVFEKLMAELLNRLGFVDIKLSRGNKDNGVDITAFLKCELGLEKIIVQCKKFSPKNKIGVQIIKQLLADIDIHDASKGLIITTSTLTAPSMLLVREKYPKISAIDKSLLIKIIENFDYDPFRTH